MEQSWLIIERFENWEVDQKNSFSFFGLPDRYHKAASEIGKGDVLYCYVSSGRLSESEFQASEANLSDYIQMHSNTKPHLVEGGRG
jgi:hypothetical protein